MYTYSEYLPIHYAKVNYARIHVIITRRGLIGPPKFANNGRDAEGGVRAGLLRKSMGSMRSF